MAVEDSTEAEMIFAGVVEAEVDVSGFVEAQVVV